MSGFAVYAHVSHDAHWELQGTFDSLAEAEAKAAGLVQGGPPQAGANSGYVEAIVEAFVAGAGAPTHLPADQLIPIAARFVRPGLSEEILPR